MCNNSEEEAKLSKLYDQWIPLVFHPTRKEEAQRTIKEINRRIEKIWLKEDKQGKVDPYMRSVFQAIYLDWKKKQENDNEI